MNQLACLVCLPLFNFSKSLKDEEADEEKHHIKEEDIHHYDRDAFLGRDEAEDTDKLSAEESKAKLA